jgi:hypothetical protein
MYLNEFSALLRQREDYRSQILGPAQQPSSWLAAANPEKRIVVVICQRMLG